MDYLLDNDVGQTPHDETAVASLSLSHGVPPVQAGKAIQTSLLYFKSLFVQELWDFGHGGSFGGCWREYRNICD
jgi:hypothetical protein